MSARYADPYEFDSRPVVSVLLASGSIHGRLAEIDGEFLSIERPTGKLFPVPLRAIEGVTPLRFPDPKIWGRNRPAGPMGRLVQQGEN